MDTDIRYDQALAGRVMVPEEITLNGLAERLDAKAENIRYLLDRLLPAIHGKFEPGPSTEDGYGTVSPRVPTYNQLNRTDDKLAAIIARLDELIGVVGA